MMFKKNIVAFVGIILCVVIVTFGVISIMHRIVPITNGMDFINEMKKKNYTIEMTDVDYDADKSMFLVKPIRITSNGNMIAIYEYSSQIGRAHV